MITYLYRPRRMSIFFTYTVLFIPPDNRIRKELCSSQFRIEGTEVLSALSKVTWVVSGRVV